jgi:hypothetical protein
MSKVFADEYKKIAASDAPDLWARIEAGLDEIAENTGIRTARDVDFAVEEPETVKLEPMSYVNRRQFWHRYGGLLAACLCAAVVAPLVYFGRGISMESDSTSAGAGAMQNVAETTTAGAVDRMDIGTTGGSADWMTGNAPDPAPLPEESGGSYVGEYDETAKAEQGFELAESPAAAMTDAQNQGSQAGDGNRDMMTNASSGAAEYAHSAYDAAGGFEMRLFTNKEVYRRDEAIMIWASLEYVGADESVTIWSADPYMVFSISDGADFQIVGLVNEIWKTTKLKRGETYSYSYFKSGAHNESAADADYWEAFYNERDLILPPGEYTVTVAGSFSLSEDGNSPSGLWCEAKIRVE